MVEFAIVFPVFFFLIMAFIDGSFGLFSRNTVGLAAADAVREASIQRSSVDADVNAVELLMSRVDTAVSTKINRVVIYEPAEFNSPPSQACQDGTADNSCSVYQGADLEVVPRVCSGANPVGWCPASRNPDDLVGIWVDAEFDSLSGLTPLSFDWSDQATATVEANVAP